MSRNSAGRARPTHSNGHAANRPKPNRFIAFCKSYTFRPVLGCLLAIVPLVGPPVVCAGSFYFGCADKVRSLIGVALAVVTAGIAGAAYAVTKFKLTTGGIKFPEEKGLAGDMPGLALVGFWVFSSLIISIPWTQYCYSSRDPRKYRTELGSDRDEPIELLERGAPITSGDETDGSVGASRWVPHRRRSSSISRRQDDRSGAGGEDSRVKTSVSGLNWFRSGREGNPPISINTAVPPEHSGDDSQASSSGVSPLSPNPPARRRN